MTIPGMSANMESGKQREENPILKVRNGQPVMGAFFDSIALELFFFPPHDTAVAQIVPAQFCLRLHL